LSYGTGTRRRRGGKIRGSQLPEQASMIYARLAATAAFAVATVAGAQTPAAPTAPAAPAGIPPPRKRAPQGRPVESPPG
jgi:hypothetical protein